MKKYHRMACVYAISIIASVYAHAQLAPPGWEIHDLCSGPKNDQCLAIENTGRLSVLARWPTVPENDRIACMQGIDRDGKRSYRGLLDCFDDRAMKALEAEPAGH